MRPSVGFAFVKYAVLEIELLCLPGNSSKCFSAISVPSKNFTLIMLVLIFLMKIY